MAKGGLLGIMTGKLGNAVYYKVTNSADKEKQGVRPYVAKIANPQTTPQATQRLRMKPAINFYRGLADLLDHSWEGVKYGALSRQKFMQLALKSDASFAIPFVTKGETRFIPGEYPVSYGSVSVPTDLSFGFYSTLGADRVVTMSNLVATDTPNDEANWGKWSQTLISLNDGLLRDGDEITLVVVYEMNGVYVPRHSYFVLDSSSTLSVADVFNAAGFVFIDSNMYFLDGVYAENEESGLEATPVNHPMVAAAVIVSRHPSRTSTTWLRSNSYMTCSGAFKSVYMTNAALQAAIASYQSKDADLTSDWLLNQAGGDVATGGSNGSQVSRTTVNYVSVTIAPTSGAVQYMMGAVLTNSNNPNGRTILSALTGTNRYLYSINGNTLVRLTNPIPNGASVSPNPISIDEALNLLPGYVVGGSGDEPNIENPD